MTQLSIADVLAEAWGLYRRFFMRLVMIAAVVYVALGIVGAALGELDSSGLGALALSIVGLAITIVGFFWVQGALVEATADMRDGRADLRVGQVYGRVAPVLATLIVAGILAGIGIVIGLIALVVPGLFLLTIWSMLAPVIVLERVPAGQAFSRSRELVRGNGWPMFGMTVLIGVASFVLSTLITSLLAAVVGDFAGRWIGGTVANSLLVPFFAVALTVAYYQLAGNSTES